MQLQAILGRLEVFLDRFPWILPLTGFLGGWLSFVLVQRGDELATVTAFAVLCGWLWLILLPLFTKYARLYTGRRLSSLLASFITQSIQQEILFFVLPFVLLSTQVDDPGQVAFAALICLTALLSTLDPLYEKYISANRAASMVFHGFCSFLSALVILPIVVPLPLEQSFQVALGLFVFGLLAALPRVGSLKKRGKTMMISLLALFALPFAIASMKAHIPAAGIIVKRALITQGVENHEPGAPLRSVERSELSRGLYAYATVSAPKGLDQRIIFRWLHDDYQEEIVSMVTGGRKEGYRTYSHKTNFIDDPLGAWTVEIITPQGQLLKALEFEVVSK